MRRAKTTVSDLFGLARNDRLVATMVTELTLATTKSLRPQATTALGRLHVDDTRQLEAARRVIAKAEHAKQGPNPRFVVASLADATRARRANSRDHRHGTGSFRGQLSRVQPTTRTRCKNSTNCSHAMCRCRNWPTTVRFR